MSNHGWLGKYHLQRSEQLESGADGRVDILRAAYSVFIEHGTNSVSMQQIADAAQMHKASLDYHFMHREDLCGSVVRRSCEHEAGRCGADPDCMRQRIF
ncbi:MAG: TetR/AcrR family transcriptional regulator [Thermomicrobiales bacterium]